MTQEPLTKRQQCPFHQWSRCRSQPGCQFAERRAKTCSRPALEPRLLLPSCPNRSPLRFSNRAGRATEFENRVKPSARLSGRRVNCSNRSLLEFSNRGGRASGFENPVKRLPPLKVLDVNRGPIDAPPLALTLE